MGGKRDVTIVGVQIGSFASFHDGRIVLDSVCTLDTLAKLREEYRIPNYITLSLPYRGYDVYTLPQDRLLIHKATFECGVQLPFHPPLCRALVLLELAPLQLSRGFWKHLNRVLKDEIDREPSFDELHFLFNIANMVPWGQFYLRASNDIKFVILGVNMKYAVP